MFEVPVAEAAALEPAEAETLLSLDDCMADNRLLPACRALPTWW